MASHCKDNRKTDRTSEELNKRNGQYPTIASETKVIIFILASAGNERINPPTFITELTIIVPKPVYALILVRCGRP